MLVRLVPASCGHLFIRTPLRKASGSSACPHRRARDRHTRPRPSPAVRHRPSAIRTPAAATRTTRTGAARTRRPAVRPDAARAAAASTIRIARSARSRRGGRRNGRRRHQRARLRSPRGACKCAGVTRWPTDCARNAKRLLTASACSCGQSPRIGETAAVRQRGVGRTGLQPHEQRLLGFGQFTCAGARSEKAGMKPSEIGAMRGRPPRSTLGVVVAGDSRSRIWRSRSGSAQRVPSA